MFEKQTYFPHTISIDVWYTIKQNKGDLESAFDNANKLFENRVLKHYEDNLLLTEYSINNYLSLHNNALQRINSWNKIILLYNSNM